MADLDALGKRLGVELSPPKSAAKFVGLAAGFYLVGNDRFFLGQGIHI